MADAGRVPRGLCPAGQGSHCDGRKDLARGQMLDENFLMALASIGAFFTGSFTEAVGVMLFYRVGEYFEDRAVARSRSQIMEAVDLRPEVVQLVDGETGAGNSRRRSEHRRRRAGSSRRPDPFGRHRGQRQQPH